MTHAQLVAFLHFSQGKFFLFFVVFAPLDHVELFVKLKHFYSWSMVTMI